MGEKVLLHEQIDYGKISRPLRSEVLRHRIAQICETCGYLPRCASREPNDVGGRTVTRVLVDVQDLHKHFGKPEVLKGINMQIHESEVVRLNRF